MKVRQSSVNYWSLCSVQYSVTGKVQHQYIYWSHKMCPELFRAGSHLNYRLTNWTGQTHQPSLIFKIL